MSDFAKIIVNVVMHYYGLPNSIIGDCGSVFISNLGHLYAFFLESIRESWPHSTYKLMAKLNSIMKTYFQVFIIFKQDNWSKILPIVENVYKDTIIANIDYTSFKLSYINHLCTSYKKDINPHFEFILADQQVNKRRKLVIIHGKNLQYK